MKLREYSASAIIVVTCNSFIWLLSRINISFFLLSACAEELLPLYSRAIKSYISIILPDPQTPDSEKDTRESNPIPYPE